MALNTIPAEVVAYGAGHDDVGVQVLSDSTVDRSVVSSMSAAFGPVGAAFAAAVESFCVTLSAAGDQLSGEYEHMADALRSGTRFVVATDESSAGQFGSSTTAL